MTKISHFAVFLQIVLFTLGFTTLSLAQNPNSFYEEDPRTFYGGLLLGTNFTQVDGDNFAGYHKVGLNAGGIVYTQFAEHVAASLEILFSQRGARSNGPKETANPTYRSMESYRIDLNYAEVPLQICYFDKRRSHFGGGFSYSQIISAKESVVTNPTFPNPDTLDNFKFKKSDLNFVLGGNLHLWKGLFLNLRFQYSLIPIRKDTYPGFGRAEQYNNSFVLRVMYLF